ncbi:MAG: hypothetical protein EOO71_03240 [Myxococcaceae bacterium]|nr:MAG: hypothetical protein EOO71_03240 [Myxococcaceae bacterium]
MPPGPRLDDFILLKRLALGAMSEVFLAEAKGAVGPDRLVALKRMRPEVAGDDAWVRQFLDEAHLSTLLHHPYPHPAGAATCACGTRTPAEHRRC